MKIDKETKYTITLNESEKSALCFAINIVNKMVEGESFANPEDFFTMDDIELYQDDIYLLHEYLSE